MLYSICMGVCWDLFLQILLSVHENSCIRNALHKPILHRRYIDDTIFSFKINTNIKEFVNFSDIQHLNIKFTCEEEIEGCIPFISISLHCCLKNTCTTVYRKATFTGLYINYESNISAINKLLIIWSFLCCANHLRTNL